MKRTSALSAGQMILLLAKIPFFRDFTQSEKELILDHAYFFIAKEQETIIQQGGFENDFYILLKGNADVMLDGGSQTLAVLQAGDFFGEISFILNTARSSNVIATDTCILLQVDRMLLNNLTTEIREKFNIQIIEKMANNIVEMNKKMFALVKSNTLIPNKFFTLNWKLILYFTTEKEFEFACCFLRQFLEEKI